MPMNLAALELRLLVVFDAVLIEASVSRAAERLGMSQPAVSNALNRLRELLNDRLFTRSSEGMRPTARALELAGPIQAAMRQIESALEPTTFQAGGGEWTFNLAVSDHASVVVLPHLIEHLAQVAPRIELTIQSKRNQDVPGGLDSNEIEIAIGVIPDLPKRFSRLDLFDDHYVCMMRHDHPLAGRPITLEAFLEVDHLAIKPGLSDTSRADRLLAQRGVRRRIVTTVHQFLAAPAIVSRSDLVVLVFGRMTQIFDSRRFYFCPVPVSGIRVTASAVWSQVHTERPAHKWMRRQIAHVVQKIAADEGPDQVYVATAA